ncbi:HalOD1 output domain-containing protein [Haladaptatus halobius]|uniref:HalOD1 output domain-containing protein n=1 Tax=Haladaptatus halobius TaxID=2884875 RepID=UPI001D0BDAF0|nr:HalOD1 output domain-containing protein [Haladaptatus halobius]
MTKHTSSENRSVDLEKRLREDRVGYDPETETYYAQYDIENVDELTTSITRSVSAVTGDPPQEFGPLYDVIDPDALEDLFDKFRRNAPDHGGVYVTFKFASCEIAVSWDGEIQITPPQDVSSAISDCGQV